MTDVRIRPLGGRDLAAINGVVTDAVMGWPLPERTRRLALPVLRYDAVDLNHFEAIGAYALDGRAKPVGLYGVALWDSQTLHGLYVLPAAQRQGVGRSLLDGVSTRAGQAGIVRLLVKAERVSAAYFQHLGLAPAGADSAYPYAFYLHTAPSAGLLHRSNRRPSQVSLR